MLKEETFSGSRNHTDFFLGQLLFIQRALSNTGTDPVFFLRISHSEWVTFQSNLKFFNHPGRVPVWNAELSLFLFPSSGPSSLPACSFFSIFFTVPPNDNRKMLERVCSHRQLHLCFIFLSDPVLTITVMNPDGETRKQSGMKQLHGLGNRSR